MPETIAERFETGKEAALRGDLEAARSSLSQISEDLSHRFSSYYLAMVELTHGDLVNARAAIQRFRQTRPEHFGGLLIAARIALMEGGLAEAKQMIETALEERPDAGNARKILDEIEARETEEAARHLVGIVDEWSADNASGDVPANVMQAARGLARLKPGRNWNQDAIHAKVASFHFAPTPEHALRNYVPELIEESVAFDYLSWPKRIQHHIRHRSVLDVGCGFGGFGTGFLAAGASSYLGIDPEMDMESRQAKNKRIREWDEMSLAPNRIQARCPDIRLIQGKGEDLSLDETFDVISLHNVTEHLIHLDQVFAGLVSVCHSNTRLIYHHHNYYCWNGHHGSPTQPDEIEGDDGNEEQQRIMDWRHIAMADEPDDYLNRVTLDEIRAITEKYFRIDVWRERLSSDATLERLTPEVFARATATHPHLTRRDLEVNLVYAECSLKR